MISGFQEDQDEAAIVLQDEPDQPQHRPLDQTEALPIASHSKGAAK